MAMPPTSAEIDSAILQLWDYHRLHHTLDLADGIVVFGSNDLRVAHHAAELYHQGFGPWILFSGARGRMTEHWPHTEAEAMAHAALEHGVPERAILIEPKATNTGENIRFTRALLAERQLQPRTLIAVQKPYMERRTLAALDTQWPEVSIRVSSPLLSFKEYCTTELPPQLVVEAMVGDFQRILDYPALGFASVQPIPEDVRQAYGILVSAGYTSHLA